VETVKQKLDEINKIKALIRTRTKEIVVNNRIKVDKGDRLDTKMI